MHPSKTHLPFPERLRKIALPFPPALEQYVKVIIPEKTTLQPSETEAEKAAPDVLREEEIEMKLVGSVKVTEEAPEEEMKEAFCEEILSKEHSSKEIEESASTIIPAFVPKKERLSNWTLSNLHFAELDAERR